MGATSTNRVRAGLFRGNRHYFRRPTHLAAWKVRLSVVAFIATSVWAVYGAIAPKQLHEAVSRGPLADPHAAWADRCDVCHTPNEEIQGGKWGIFDCRDRWQSFRCETCHAGAPGAEKNYAPHHANAVWPESRGNACAACHRDHQGKGYSLTRIADIDCVQCHRDLKDFHSAPGEMQAVNSITGVADHPDFRVLKSPPERTLKFSHAHHLNPGIVASQSAVDNPKAAWTIDQIPEAYREQYRPYVKDGRLQLDCSACHELDANGKLAPSGLPPSANGRVGNYQPIVFEKHCQGCHSLTVSGLQSEKGVAIAPFEVPHRRNGDDLTRLVRGELLRQIESKQKLLLQVPLPPSDRLDSPRVELPSNLGKQVDDLATKAMTNLYSVGAGCQKCHEPAETGLPALQKTVIPAAWLHRAKFDHSAHRMMKCDGCHDSKKAAFSDGPFNVKESLAIPGMDNCRQCHAPTKGARHDCVECHQYHHRPTSLQLDQRKAPHDWLKR